MRVFRSFSLENIDKIQLAFRLLTDPHHRLYQPFNRGTETHL